MCFLVSLVVKHRLNFKLNAALDRLILVIITITITITTTTTTTITITTTIIIITIIIINSIIIITRTFPASSASETFAY